MRILHAIDTLEPVGGAQIYVHAISQLLSAAGHEVAVLHTDSTAEAPDGIPTRQLGTAGCAQWVLDFAPDVIHAHDGILAAGVVTGDAPVVRSLHNFDFACSSGTKYFRDGTICTRAHGPGCLVASVARGCVHRRDPRSFIARYTQLSRERLRDRPETVLFHSDYMRSVGIANGLLDSRVIPLFIDRPATPPPPAAGRSLAFAGRIVPDKGLDVLLSALASRVDAWDELYVAGDGWDRARCEELARKHGLGSKVSFVGHVSTPEVRELFAHVCLVVVPSRWPEPFGIVGLEAMAQARAVVASRAGGIPEWLVDGETGSLVEPGDADALAEAIVSLLADPAKTAALGSNGWQRAALFSPEEHVHRLVALYEGAIATEPRAMRSPSRLPS